MCSKDLNLNLEDFPQLPRIVPVCNSVSFSKFIIKVSSTSSIRPGKPICDSNVPPSKPVSASFVRKSKPIGNRNVCPSKTVGAISVNPIFGSSARVGKPILASEHVSVSVCPGKSVCTPQSRSICGSKVCQSKPTIDSNIHHKLIRPNRICFINSSVSTQQVSFIFLFPF